MPETTEQLVDAARQKKAAWEAARTREREASEKLKAVHLEFTQRLTAARTELSKPVTAAHAEHAQADADVKKAKSDYDAAMAALSQVTSDK